MGRPRKVAVVHEAVIVTAKKTAQDIPYPWPNGSGVYTIPSDDKPRHEIGRIYKTPLGDFRILALEGHDYEDLGTATSYHEALMRLPYAVTLEPDKSMIDTQAPRRRGRPPKAR